MGAPVVRPAGPGEGGVADQKVSVFQEGVDEDVVAFRVILFILVVGDIPDNTGDQKPSLLFYHLAHQPGDFVLICALKDGSLALIVIGRIIPFLDELDPAACQL